jgi:hypothetical protein
VIYWPAVAAASFFVLLWLFVALFPWQAWAEMFRRGWKYARVTFEQMRPEERQVSVFEAVIVVWYVVWSVAIWKGTP